MTMMKRAVIWTAVVVVLPALASAEVSRVEVASRADVLGGRPFGSAGSYELVVGRIHFTVDPAGSRNRIVVDLDKARRDRAGLVEMTADLSILKPKDPARGNGVALVDIVNRGRRTLLGSFNRAAGGADLSSEAAFGDGLLMRQGFTLVWVGWEFDVGAGLTRLDVPGADGVAARVRAFVTPSARSQTATFADLTLGGYEPRDAASPDNTLTVREIVQGAPTVLDRARWHLSGNAVTLDGGFEPGRTYELSYAAARAPVAGLGFVAVRDTASWIKYAADPLVSAKYAYAFGSSQSGRFLRTFLYQGFNTDEKNRQVFDAVLANIAGASRINLNDRGATPTAQAQFTATSFPFADRRLRDPVTGATEGALDNSRARDRQPKIFYTNTGVEYWGGARSAALIHTSPDGAKDLALPDNERVYFLAGSQHTPTAFPPRITNGRQRENPNYYWWTMRALLLAMDQWVRQGVAPPESRYPRLQDGTLVRSTDVAWPAVPSVASPRSVAPGSRSANRFVAGDGAPGAPLPLLVPQVDRDGNERAGIRLPDVAVPLATFTGWNFRKPGIGGPTQLFPLMGSFIPFPAMKTDRERSQDPRPSLEERYASRDRYLALVREAAAALVKDRYLLGEDVPPILERAAMEWDALTGNATASPQ